MQISFNLNMFLFVKWSVKSFFGVFFSQWKQDLKVCLLLLSSICPFPSQLAEKSASRSGCRAMHTWQIPSSGCAEQIILSGASLILRSFKAKLLNPPLCCTAAIASLVIYYHVVSLQSSRPILSLGIIHITRGERVIFSKAVTWCECKWSLTAVGYWYNMLCIHRSLLGTNESHPVDLKKF